MPLVEEENSRNERLGNKTLQNLSFMLRLLNIGGVSIKLGRSIGQSFRRFHPYKKMFTLANIQ